MTSQRSMGLPGYTPLRHVCHVIDRPSRWVYRKITLWGEKISLLKRAVKWHQIRKAAENGPYTSYRLYRGCREISQRPPLNLYLQQVGLPDALFSRLLWEALREDWTKACRQFRRARRMSHLIPWEEVSAPSYDGPLLMPPRSSLKRSTG